MSKAAAIKSQVEAGEARAISENLERLAGIAMHALLLTRHGATPEQIAAEAHNQAEAMIAERDRRNSPLANSPVKTT